MTAMDFSGVIELDSSDFVGGVEDATEATEDLEDSAENVSESFVDINSKGLIAGAGMATAGAGAQGLLDGTRDVRTELGFAAETFGTTQDEMVDLVDSLADGTLEFDDAADAVGNWVSQGVDNQDDLQELVETSDLIADATGTSADVISGRLAPVMASFGEEAEDVADIQDDFTVAIQETLLDADELPRLLERSSDEMEEMGLGTDDAIGLIAEFQEETGLAGRELRTELNQALNDADGDLDAFIENTDLSESALEDWEKRIEESEGATQRYADVTEENTTLMDDMRQTVRGTTAQVGNMLAPVNAAAPAMMGLGGAASFLSAINVGMLVPSLTGVAAALTPLLPIILPLVAIAAVLAAAWKTNFLDIQGVTDDVIDGIRNVIEGFIEWLEPFWDAFTAALSGDWDEALESWETGIENTVDIITGVVSDFVETIKTTVTEGWDDLVSWITDIGADDIEDAFHTIGSAIRTVVLTYFKIYGTLWNVVTDGIDALVTYFKEDAKDDLKEGITAAFDALVDAGRAALEALTPTDGVIVDIITDIVDYLIHEAPGLVADAIEAVIDVVMAAFTGLYDGLIGNSLIPDLLDDIISEITDWDIVGAFTDKLDGVKDAFNNVKDTIVGNSIVPEMVDDVGAEFERMNAEVDTNLGTFEQSVDAVTTPPDSPDNTGSNGRGPVVEIHNLQIDAQDRQAGRNAADAFAKELHRAFRSQGLDRNV